MNKEVAKRVVFLILFVCAIIIERVSFQLLRPFVDISKNLQLGFLSVPGYWFYILIAAAILVLFMTIYVKFVSAIEKRKTMEGTIDVPDDHPAVRSD